MLTFYQTIDLHGYKREGKYLWMWVRIFWNKQDNAAAS